MRMQFQFYGTSIILDGIDQVRCIFGLICRPRPALEIVL